MGVSFDRAFALTIGLEGGYTNDPNDSGGETMYGITARTWAAYCAEVGIGVTAVKNITLAQAKAVYLRDYWNPLGLDNIKDARVAGEIFDTAVNCGLQTATLIAQRAVNLLHDDVCDLVKEDGRMGALTRGALNALSVRYANSLLFALNGFQFERYVEVAQNNQKNRTFLRGWMQRLGVAP